MIIRWNRTIISHLPDFENPGGVAGSAHSRSKEYQTAIFGHFDRGFLVYSSGLSPGYAGLVPDLSGLWYGYAMKMVYFRDGVFTLKPPAKDALIIIIKYNVM